MTIIPVNEIKPKYEPKLDVSLMASMALRGILAELKENSENKQKVLATN